MNQDIERAIAFSIPVVSAAISLVMILLDTTRSSNTVNRKIHYSMITVYSLIMLYWSGLVMHSIARDAFIAYLPVFFSSFSFIPAFEIIKVGKMRVKRKAQKNTAIQLYLKHLQLD